MDLQYTYILKQYKIGVLQNYYLTSSYYIQLIIDIPSETKWRQPEVQKRLPQCIILGMRKAGTNALKNFMAIHPDVVAAWGEPHFFGKAENYTKGMGSNLKT